MILRSPTRIGLWLAMVLLYSWPALWNGGPFFFPDSSHYIRSADAAVVSLTGVRSEWSDRLILTDGREGTAATADGGNAGSTPIRSTRTVLTGRSIYYGALLYGGFAFGKYGPVFIQSAIAVTAVGLFLFGASQSSDPSHRGRWIWGGLLAIGTLTPLPFFLSRLMPDAFTGLLAVALVALLAFWDRYTRIAQAFLVALASAAILFHTSHILLTVAIGAAALLLTIGSKASWTRVIVLPAVLMLLAAGGQMLFSAAVTQTLGAPPISPPFMSARLIADGPGYAYLKTHCGEGHFVLCRYLDRMPKGSDTLLWSEDPRDGVFSTVSDPVKRALGRQDTAFYIAVLKDRPLEVIGSMAGSIAKQTVEFDLDHFNYIPIHREGARLHLPDATFRWVEQSAAYRGSVPIAPTVILSIATTIASLLIITIAIIQAVRRKTWRSPVITATFLLVLAVAANVVICGALSTPHARYLMRIIWLLPLVVAALGASGFQFRLTRFIPTGETAAP